MPGSDTHSSSSSKSSSSENWKQQQHAAPTAAADNDAPDKQADASSSVPPAAAQHAQHNADHGTAPQPAVAAQVDAVDDAIQQVNDFDVTSPPSYQADDRHLPSFLAPPVNRSAAAQPTPMSPTTAATIIEQIPESVRLNADHYKIESEPLGSGGFGCVFRANQKGIKRAVAVKKFHRTGKPAQFARAVGEAVRSVELSHPNVVSSLGIIIASVMGLFEVFIVMELAEKSLSSLLKECKYQLPFDKCFLFAQQIAAGLEYLHSSQPRILHLDLKPCNALVFDQGRFVKLCDFGVSVDVEGSHESVTSGAIGTYRWMAPEILLDKKQLRPQCDVYSFGAILYCFVCGKEPWAELDPKSAEMRLKIDSGTLVDTITPRKGCPPLLIDLCRRCLQKDPTQRPKDGAELVQHLSGGAAIVPSAPTAAAAPAVSSAASDKPSLADDWMSVLQLDEEEKQGLTQQRISSLDMFLALSDDEMKDIFNTVGQRKTVKAEMQRLANAIEAEKVQKAKVDAIRAKGLTIVEIDIAKSFQDLLAVLKPFAGKKSCVHLRFTNPSKAQKVTCFDGKWGHDEWEPFERVIASVDLNELTDVTEIGDCFLYRCYELKEVDLSGFRNVTTIGGYFLCGCSGLTQLDLSQLSNVTTIGTHFLCGCSGLTQLDLSPLSNVTSIGYGFLAGCSGLTQLDLSPLWKVTTIGDFFLSSCRGLTQLDLSQLSNVTTIGSCFLLRCGGLTQLAMSGMEKVKSVGWFFLYECSNLRSVKLSAALMQSSDVPGDVKKLMKK